MTREKAADGEAPHLFPSLHHMEVPAMCSHYSAALVGVHKTGSLQGERKRSDQQSLNPLNTLAQAKNISGLQRSSAQCKQVGDG